LPPGGPLINHSQAADVLSKESGYSLATPTTLAFQDAVAGGRWSEALALLPEMGISHSPKSASIHGLADLQNEMPNPIDHATFLIARQKYLEYLEAGQHKKALSVLRTELAASGCPPDVLHNLSG
jgi:hypothetical protein